LAENQWAFGDCGAFSYVNEDRPSVSVEEAAAMYQLYGFDLGASVDHIPVPEIITADGKKKTLSIAERRGRILVTQRNAETFIELYKKHRYTFAPVGVIQGLTAESYGRQLHRYVEMGYRHIAFGGLVPRSDADIVEIIEKIRKARAALPKSVDDFLWTHLFGVFRPKIQKVIRQAHITSFDSATYFRKAWLRSDQNYLGTDRNWYAAIRIPLTSDPRTRKRLKGTGLKLEELERREKLALKALQEYGKHRRSIESTLEAIFDYDFLLTRSDDHGEALIESYRETLESRAWEECSCHVCSTIGIHALIFRGYNRNKRRGAHNTLMLYKSLKGQL
jgi:queuine/archaeosine tRNA-ribosyltransferase